MQTQTADSGLEIFSVSMPRDEKEKIDRKAFELDVSRNSFIRKFFLKGLEAEYPELAAEIKTVREKHRLGARIVAARAASAIILGLFVLVSSTGKTEIRRPSQVRVRRWEEAV